MRTQPTRRKLNLERAAQSLHKELRAEDESQKALFAKLAQT
jgi:hypothetical protein